MKENIVKTWQDVYTHAKSKKNPLKLSSSEHRNLTKKVTEHIFKQGQANAGKGVNHSAAIHVINAMAGKMKVGGERHKALMRAVVSLEEDEAGGKKKAA